MTATVRPARKNLQSFSALWRFEQGPPAFSGGFITSDHPYCLLWTDPPARRIPSGLGKRNTEIVFPLSNRLALIGAFELENGFQEITESQVSDINGTIALFADRHVYARDLNFTYTIKEDQPNRKASKLIEDVHFLRPDKKDEG